MEAKQLEEWCIKEFREIERLTGREIDKSLISYLLTLPNESSIEEYIPVLIGKTKQCKSFIREYLVRWRSTKEEQEIMVPLKRLDSDQMVLFENKKSKSKKKAGKTAPPGFEPNPSSAPSTKPKYVPLISSKGQDRLTLNIPGRHPCQCLGQKHDLINNCLECGRIICSQEGAGPCLFCSTIVFTRDEEQLLSRDSKRAEKKKEKMWNQYNIKGDNPSLSINQFDDDLIKATEHKDKLVHFDKTSMKRTKVVDDESDYFQVDNQWLSEGQRKALKKKEDELREAKYGSRISRGVKVTLDISGREIAEEESKNIDLYSEDHVKRITDDHHKSSRTTEGHYEIVQKGISDPSIPVPPPMYLATKKNQLKNNINKSSVNCDRISRLQDGILFEMKDEGKCLSMHQPWASLLVCGIKRFEGRSWYTHHRGKLWIASTAKPVEQGDINQQEDYYRQLYRNYEGDDDIEFPSSYPHGCLLGCTDLVDCLSMEECNEKYPENDSQSPYVFVCENPQELQIKFPIKGKHKIWKLDSDIHQSAKRGLQPL